MTSLPSLRLQTSTEVTRENFPASPSSSLFERSIGALVSNLKSNLEEPLSGQVSCNLPQNSDHSHPTPKSTPEFQVNTQNLRQLQNPSIKSIQLSPQQVISPTTAARKFFSFDETLSPVAERSPQKIQENQRDSRDPTVDYVMGTFMDSLKTLNSSGLPQDSPPKAEEPSPYMAPHTNQSTSGLQYGQSMLLVDNTTENTEAPITSSIFSDFLSSSMGNGTTTDSYGSSGMNDQSYGFYPPYHNPGYVGEQKLPTHFRGSYVIKPSDGSSRNPKGAAMAAAAQASQASHAFPGLPYNKNFKGVNRPVVPSPLSSIMPPSYSDESLDDYSGSSQFRQDGQYFPSGQEDEKRVYECSFHTCRKTFKKAISLESHLRTCHGEDGGAIASTLFQPNNQQVAGTEEIDHETGKKIFSCKICGQTFSRSHDLKRHCYIHSQEKPFPCLRCGKGFARRDALKRHERAVLEGKKVQCIPSGGYTPAMNVGYPEEGVDNKRLKMDSYDYNSSTVNYGQPNWCSKFAFLLVAATLIKFLLLMSAQLQLIVVNPVVNSLVGNQWEQSVNQEANNVVGSFSAAKGTLVNITNSEGITSYFISAESAELDQMNTSSSGSVLAAPFVVMIGVLAVVVIVAIAMLITRKRTSVAKEIKRKQTGMSLKDGLSSVGIREKSSLSVGPGLPVWDSGKWKMVTPADQLDSKPLMTFAAIRPSNMQSKRRVIVDDHEVVDVPEYASSECSDDAVVGFEDEPNTTQK